MGPSLRWDDEFGKIELFVCRRFCQNMPLTLALNFNSITLPEFKLISKTLRECHGKTAVRKPHDNSFPLAWLNGVCGIDSHLGLSLIFRH